MSSFFRRQLDMYFKGTESCVSSKMLNALKEWDLLYTQSYTNVASVLSSEAARLATIDMKISFTGGERAQLLSSVFKKYERTFREKLELGIAYGSMIIKPLEDGTLDFVPPTRYVPVEFDDSGNIRGIVFLDTYQKGKKYYNRLEYHYFDEDLETGEELYVIKNRYFLSETSYDIGQAVGKKVLPIWRNIEDEVVLTGVTKPLYGYFKMPSANNVDIDSPMGVSIFSKAVLALKDFESLYMKWRTEIDFSEKKLFVDESTMMKGAGGKNPAIIENPIPKLIKGLRFGVNSSKSIEEWNPSFRVTDYSNAMKTQLNLISVLSGFSPGFLTFDERTGQVTATQIESEDQRTLSTCTDIQSNYKAALEGLLYAVNVWADVNELSVNDEYEVSFYMRDLFVNTSEDRKRAYELAQNKYIPKWKYLVDYEGYTEEDAKNMVSEAETSQGNAPDPSKGVLVGKDGRPLIGG